MTEENAHPHSDTSGRVHIVLNGIVENWTELRDRLEADGAEFTSETDAEVVAHLIATHFDGDLVEAVRAGLQRAARPLRLRRDVRRRARRAGGRPQGVPAGGGPGRGRELHRLRHPGLPGRDPPRAAGRGRRDRGRHARRRRASSTPDGAQLEREIDEVDWDEDAAEKGGYETFMLKEIHEQPDAVAETRGRPPGRRRRSDLGDIGISDDELRDVRRVVIVACGTSYHAGPGGPLRDRGVGAASRWRWTSPRSSATATRCSASTTW